MPERCKSLNSLKHKGFEVRSPCIGSGVTEAACKTIFTQRFKRSGMSWNHAGDTQGQRILDLRTIRLSRLWTTVHRDMLRNQKIVNTSTKPQIANLTHQIAA